VDILSIPYFLFQGQIFKASTEDFANNRSGSGISKPNLVVIVLYFVVSVLPFSSDLCFSL
jgi:hypothetical protein